MSPIATTNEKISSTVKRETSRLLVDVKHRTRNRPDTRPTLPSLCCHCTYHPSLHRIQAGAQNSYV
jgi:hypothetical protein